MNPSVDVNTVPFSRPFVEIQPQQQLSTDKMREGQNLSSSSSSLGKVPTTTGTPNQVQQQAARRLWWQKSIVRRSFTTIEKEVQNLISSSPYLHQHYHCDNIAQQQQNHFLQRGIAKFHRKEIITGPILGKGGFSQVMEIVAFQLIPEISQQCTVEEQELRQRYVSSVYDTNMGKNRYCIKHLQEKIVRGSNSRGSSSSQKNDEFQLAASDLFIESVTLSILQHENIISLRGLPIHGLQSWKTGLYDSYFIIMDQLSTTLDKRIEEWKIAHTSSSNKSSLILQEKVQCAYQLALALTYIHSNRLLYRDLKPQNIGFSLQDPNKIQLFDFGLCRELPTTRNTIDAHNPFGTDDIYEMSGVGTRRYMAPEIVTIGQYNQKADVYSWSMVFYELLTCIKPYVTYSTEDHTTHVCYNNERPNVPLSFPYWIHSILQNAWDENVKTRSTTFDVCQQLQAAYVKLSGNCSSMDNELYVTNHDSLISKEYALPNSPTGVNDFPTMTNRNDLRTVQVQSMSYTNNNNESESSHSFHEMPLSNNSDDHNICENYCSTTMNDDVLYLPLQDSTTTVPTGLVDCSCVVSPPPAPKRPPTIFVQVPDDLIRTFELSLSDNDDDDVDDDAVRITEVSRIHV